MKRTQDKAGTRWPYVAAAALVAMLAIGATTLAAGRPAPAAAGSVTFGAADQHSCRSLLEKLVRATNEVDVGRYAGESMSAGCPGFRSPSP